VALAVVGCTVGFAVVGCTVDEETKAQKSRATQPVLPLYEV